MNKTIKLIAILLLTAVLVMTLGNVSFAKDEKDAEASSASSVISSFDQNSGYKSEDIKGVSDIAQKVLTAIRNLSIIVAVIMISVLGIKYMVGSAEEKAGYKKAFIPLIVGAILVVSAASLATMLFSLKG